MVDKRRLLKEEESRLLSKWEPFLEGIDDGYTKINTAMLLENEAEYLLEAANNTAASDVVGIQKIMLPIVRRVFPNLIANNIVSVQPMAGPAAVIFYLKYVFGSEKGNVAQGAEYSAFAADAPLQHPDEGWQGYSPYYSKQTVGPFVANSSGTTATFAMNTLTSSHTHDSWKWAAALSSKAAVEGTIIREVATDLDTGESGGEVVYSFTGNCGAGGSAVDDC